MTAFVAVLHPRRAVRVAVRRGLERVARRGGPAMRSCDSAAALERLLGERLVDAVVLDVKTADEAALARRLVRDYPRIPCFALSPFRADDGAAIREWQRAGLAGALVEGVDDAVAGEWVAQRGAGALRREALGPAPRLLRLTDQLQLVVWEEVLRRVARPMATADLARAVGVSREHLSRQFAAGGAPNLKRVIDLARAACAADLLGNPGYTVRRVAAVLGYASGAHLALTARRVAGVALGELGGLGAGGVLAKFVRGRTRSRL